MESLRGLAIILMVLGHVIGDTAASGLRVPDDSACRYWYFALQYFRMPLFTVIAGYVYALRPVRSSGARMFLARKAERLYLPLLTVGTLQYLLHSSIAATNTHPPLSGIWRMYVLGVDQFWFLHAIMLVFLTITLIDCYGLIDRFGRWLGAVAATTVLSLIRPDWEIFSFEGFLYLLPYFLLGYGFVRYKERIFQPRVLIPASALLVLGVAAQQLIWLGVLHFEDQRVNPVSACVGLCGTTLLFALRKPIRWLAWCGTYSYGIFLFHVFPVAASRIALTRLGVHATGWLLAAGVLLGVLVPIGLEMLIGESALLDHWLLGNRSTPPGESGRT